MSNQLTPVLNIEQLQEKANEFAQEGFLKYMKEYYTGYSSPYQKALSEHFENANTNFSFDLPDIVGVLNDMVSQEVDKIANAAIANTFLPKVRKMLTRVEGPVYFSAILRKSIEDGYNVSFNDCEVSVEEHQTYGWLSVNITVEDKSYEFTLHKIDKSANGKTYNLLGLPNKYSTKNQSMRIEVDGAKIEMPFSANILHDGFTSYLASLILSDVEIIIDQEEFDYEMFDNHCHC